MKEVVTGHSGAPPSSIEKAPKETEMMDITFLEEANRLQLLIPWESVWQPCRHMVAPRNVKEDLGHPSVWISINRG